MRMYAKGFREWYAFYGGEELGISFEKASIIWEAAVKSVEPDFDFCHNCKLSAEKSCKVEKKCVYHIPLNCDER